MASEPRADVLSKIALGGTILVGLAELLVVILFLLIKYLPGNDPLLGYGSVVAFGFLSYAGFLFGIAWILVVSMIQLVFRKRFSDRARRRVWISLGGSLQAIVVIFIIIFLT